jgi:hypothetical protein
VPPAIGGDLDRTIGTNPAGQAATRPRVHRRWDDTVKTAFPSRKTSDGGDSVVIELDFVAADSPELWNRTGRAQAMINR